MLKHFSRVYGLDGCLCVITQASIYVMLANVQLAKHKDDMGREHRR